jgi:hypothetical protein
VRGQILPESAFHDGLISHSSKDVDTPLQQEVRENIAELQSKHGRCPGLEKRIAATFAEHGMVDNDPPSADFWLEQGHQPL